MRVRPLLWQGQIQALILHDRDFFRVDRSVREKNIPHAFLIRRPAHPDTAQEVEQMMRKWLVVLGLLLVPSAVALAVNARMIVQVQRGQIRATPSYLASVLATVPYGVSVEILQTKGEWMQVKSLQGQVGWMHKSALTTKAVPMSSGSTTAKTGATSDELALAGKGFNSDIEREFKAKNKNLNFAAVDRMERIKISPAEMQVFLQTGAVKPLEGGVQ
jgi:hypothetical protein